MLRSTFPLLFLSAALAGAETIEFDIKAGDTQSVPLPSPVDDSHLRDPRGYEEHGAQARVFTRRITLSNTGGKPLTGSLLIVNGRDFSKPEGFRTALGLSGGRLAMERLYTRWTGLRSHFATGSTLSEEPLATLNFWGYTQCGDDTASLARLAALFEIPARHVPLNGHLAAEYQYDGGWHVVDGDQNACYLRLDNRSLASAEDIRNDPFLALRTKVFGKHGPMSRAESTFNTSLFEHVAPGEPKAIRLKTGPAPLNAFTLEQGESLTWRCDAPPEKPAGGPAAEAAAKIAPIALATIEHRLNGKARERDDKGLLTVRGPYPILKVVNETTGETVEPKEIAFKAAIATKSPADKVLLVMQCSRNALPLLSKGENAVRLDAAKGSAHVAYEYDPMPKAVLASVAVVPTAKGGRFSGSPSFTLESRPPARRVWWQISPERDFSFVPPNFDGLETMTPTLNLDPLTETFFSAGRTYYIRARVHSGNVWSEWSTPASFRMDRPAQPGEPSFSPIPGGGVRLSWIGVAEEYLVFASNRVDFMPELFGAEEIAGMQQKTVTLKRPNQNLVATVRNAEVELTSLHRYYRVIAKKGGTYSVPGALWKLPAEYASKLPDAMVLQGRVSKKDGRETYSASEVKLVPPAPPAPPAPPKAPEAVQVKELKKEIIKEPAPAKPAPAGS